MASNSIQIQYCISCDAPMAPGKPCKRCSTKQKEDVAVSHYCAAVENGRRCNSTLKLISIANQQFWCITHYEKFHEKSYTDKVAYDGSIVFSAAVKSSGLKPSEYFRQHFGFDLKDVGKELTRPRTNNVKTILEKQNHPYAVMNKD